MESLYRELLAVSQSTGPAAAGGSGSAAAGHDGTPSAELTQVKTDAILKLWATYQKSQFPPSAVAVSIATATYARSGLHMMALLLFRALPHFPWTMDGIEAAMAAAHSVGDIDCFLECLKRAEAIGQPAQPRHLELLLGTCVRGKEPGRAYAVWRQMGGSGNGPLYAALIDNALESGDLERGSFAFRDLVRYFFWVADSETAAAAAAAASSDAGAGGGVQQSVRRYYDELAEPRVAEARGALEEAFAADCANRDLAGIADAFVGGEFDPAYWQGGFDNGREFLAALRSRLEERRVRMQDTERVRTEYAQAVVAATASGAAQASAASPSRRGPSATAPASASTVAMGAVPCPPFAHNPNGQLRDIVAPRLERLLELAGAKRDPDSAYILVRSAQAVGVRAPLHLIDGLLRDAARLGHAPLAEALVAEIVLWGDAAQGNTQPGRPNGEHMSALVAAYAKSQHLEAAFRTLFLGATYGCAPVPASSVAAGFNIRGQDAAGADPASLSAATPSVAWQCDEDTKDVLANALSVFLIGHKLSRKKIAAMAAAGSAGQQGMHATAAGVDAGIDSVAVQDEEVDIAARTGATAANAEDSFGDASKRDIDDRDQSGLAMQLLKQENSVNPLGTSGSGVESFNLLDELNLAINNDNASTLLSQQQQQHAAPLSDAAPGAPNAQGPDEELAFATDSPSSDGLDTDFDASSGTDAGASAAATGLDEYGVQSNLASLMLGSSSGASGSGSGVREAVGLDLLLSGVGIYNSDRHLAQITNGGRGLERVFSMVTNGALDGLVLGPAWATSYALHSLELGRYWLDHGRPNSASEPMSIRDRFVAETLPSADAASAAAPFPHPLAIGQSDVRVTATITDRLRAVRTRSPSDLLPLHQSIASFVDARRRCVIEDPAPVALSARTNATLSDCFVIGIDPSLDRPHRKVSMYEVLPPVVLYNVFLGGVSGSKIIFDSVRHIWNAVAKREPGIKADQEVYLNLLKDVCLPPFVYPTLARSHLRDMRLRGLEPDARIYGMLCRMLIFSNKVPAACTLLGKACSEKKAPSWDIFELAIRAVAWDAGSAINMANKEKEGSKNPDDQEASARKISKAIQDGLDMCSRLKKLARTAGYHVPPSVSEYVNLRLRRRNPLLPHQKEFLEFQRAPTREAAPTYIDSEDSSALGPGTAAFSSSDSTMRSGEGRSERLE
jgi:hypothetical protein